MPDKRVFIVEDEAVVAFDLEDRLKKLGYEFAGQASSGEEAIQQVGACSPDLVLMDIRLKGGMDGIEAAGVIRRRFDIPVVFVTAFNDETTLQRARVSEPYGYVQKPFEERELHIAIEIAVYRHEVESKLRSVERWLATTLESIGDGVIATDLNGMVSFLNPIAERLTGWPREEAVGRQFDDILPLVNANTHLPQESVVDQVLRSGLIVNIAADSLLVTRRGIEIPVDDSAAPLLDEENKIIGVVVVFRDVSERVRVERELMESQERLRQSQKMEAIGRLAGGVAHDFNNLLTVLIGHAEMLLREPSLDTQCRRRVQEMHGASVRAVELTRQLLAYSRRQVLRPREVDINEVLQKMSGMLRRLLSEDIILEEWLAPELGKIFVDPAQLEQVMMNLAVNARDAMPKGGRLIVETEDAMLDDEAARRFELSPDPFVVLTVKDTGAGMDAATKDQIFEPFFTTKPLGKGTGLGLATVFGVVKQSRGHIEVSSKVDEGTTFKLYFPRVEAVQLEETLPDDTVPEPMAKRGERILVVEDNDMVRAMLRDILQLAGYSVIEAAGSNDALKLLDRLGSGIDLVVTDIVMPGVTGPDLIKQMRTLRPNLKALFMSGYSEEAILRYGMLESGTAFVSKPFSSRAIGLKVRELLDEE